VAAPAAAYCASEALPLDAALTGIEFVADYEYLILLNCSGDFATLHERAL
jgi:hypothetical protein